MPIRYSSTSGGGIPFGDDAKRPLTPSVGQPYFNGEASRLELYTSSVGWQNIVQETPAVVNVVGVYRESQLSSTLTLNGTNFAVGAIAYAVGTNGIEIQADTTSLVSVVEITAVFSGLSKLHEPYDIKVVNPSNLYGILYETLYVDETSIWATQSGTLGTYIEKSPMSVSLSSSDPELSQITYSLDSGSLPIGLSLNISTGVISGTPENILTNSTYSFSINSSDGQNNNTRQFSITITDIGPSWITGQSLPLFSKGSAYSTTVSASDDDNISSYSLISGSLPAGLSLNQQSGTISGTPTSSSNTLFTIRATDVGGNYADRQFTINNYGPSWVTSGIIAMLAGATSQISAVDDSGVSPTYSVVSGAFPSGTSLSSSGLLTAGPSTGSSSAVVRATDANGGYTDQTLTVAIQSATFLINGSATIGTLNYTYSMSGGNYYSFNFTGSVWKKAKLKLYGAGGGNTNLPGGAGGYVEGIVDLTTIPNRQFTVVVGGAGTNSATGQGGPNGGSYTVGGYNGGGRGIGAGSGNTGGGGGATDARLNWTSVTDYSGAARFLVAGGGGGGTNNTNSYGGAGAYPNGGAGLGYGGAVGGSQTAGGHRGGGFGYGGENTLNSGWNGGGGGGWYGGGACSDQHGGGAGGSSYYDPTYISSFAHTSGGGASTQNAGSAQLIIIE